MTKKMNRVLSMLMVILMLVSMLPTNVLAETGTNAERSEGISILAAGSDIQFPYVATGEWGQLFDGGYITSKQIAYDTVENDQAWKTRINLTFTIPPSALRVKEEAGIYHLKTQWYFDLQDDLNVNWDNSLSDNGKITKTVDGVSTVIGRYKVVDGQFRIFFDADYVYDQMMNNSKGIVCDNLMVAGYWYSGEELDENRTEVGLGSDKHVIYPHGIGDVTIDKKLNSIYAIANGNVEWEIEVGTTEGTGGNIILTDTLGENLRIESVEVKKAGTNNRVPASYTQDGRTITVNLDPISYANRNQRHYVYITTEVVRPAGTVESNGFRGNNSTISTVNMEQSNTATVVTTGFDGKLTESKSDGDTVSDPQITVDKTAGSSMDADGNISWTITVNASNANIAGLVLHDEMMKHAVGNVSVTDGNRTVNKDAGTVTFSAGSDGKNTASYTITYKTRATVDSDGTYTYQNSDGTHTVTDVCYSDDNLVTLEKTNGTVIARDYDFQYYTRAAYDYIQKESELVGDVVTYTITVNNQGNDLTGFDKITDTLKIDGNVVDPDNLPTGFELVPHSIKVGTTEYTTVAAAISGLNQKINTDIANGNKHNTYTLTYAVTVPLYDSGTIWNYASAVFRFGTDYADDGGKNLPGIPVVEKQAGGAVVNSRYFKWTLVINKDGAPMNNWTITDTLSNGSRALVNGQQVWIDGVQQPDWNFTSLDDLEDELNDLMEDGSEKIKVEYYTLVEKIGSVTNTAVVTINGQDKNAEVTNTANFDHGITKEGVGVEEGDIHELKWKVRYPLPTMYLPGEIAVIEDRFPDGQYMTGDDWTALSNSVANRFPARSYNLTKKLDDGLIVGYEIRFNINGIPCENKPNVNDQYFYFSTRVAADVVAAVHRNTVSATIVNRENSTKTSTGTNKVESKFDLVKWFSGKYMDEAAKKVYGDQLEWTITMTVPQGAQGKQIQIWDNLLKYNAPNIVWTRAKVYVGGQEKYNEAADANGTFAVKTQDYVTFSNQDSHSKLVTIGRDHNYPAGTEIRIVLSARMKDRNVAAHTVENTADAHISYDGGTITDSSSCSVIVVQPEKDIVVTKGGRLTDPDAAGSTDTERNVLKYSVVINEKAEKLLTGEGKLFAVDTLSWSGNDQVTANNFDIIANSVKLTYLNGENAGKEVPGWTSWNHYVRDDGKAHIIELNDLPDGVALKFSYDYKLISEKVFTGLKVENHFQFNGYENGTGVTSKPIEVKYVESLMSVKSYDVAFFKHVAGKQGNTLQGAEFELYKYDGGWGDPIATAVSGVGGKLIFTPDFGDYAVNTAYKLVETKAPIGYEPDPTPYIFAFGDDPDYEGEDERLKGGTYWIANAPKTTTATVVKVWDDNNNQDAIQPASLTVKLLADGTFVQNVTLPNEKGEWTATVSGLKKYRDNATAENKANEIVYTWGEEVVPEGYTLIGNTTSGTITTLTNTHVPAKVEAKVVKVWEDNNDQDGVRPKTLKVTLKADGVEKQEVTLSESNGWQYTVENLPKFAKSTTPINYTWVEDTTGLTWTNGDKTVGYTQKTPVVTNETNADGVVTGTITTLTNTYTPETTSVSVTKKWVDGNNAAGKRPASITINLLATITVNGTDVTEKVKSQSVTADNDGNWSYTFTDLPKYKNYVDAEGNVLHGNLITYTITEDPINKENSSEPLYHTVVDGYNVTNTLLTEVEGDKRWIDDGSAARPEEIFITLCGADGVTPVTENAAGEPIGRVKVTAEDDWAWSFTYLPKYTEGGAEIVYTVKEDAVYGYSTKVTGYNVTNTQLTEIPVTKVWDDNDDQDGVRPEYIQVTLHRSYTDDERGTVEEIVETKKLTKNNIVNENANTWGWTFTDLPKYYDEGKPYKYWVTEDTVGSYESSITGPDANGNLVTITNCHEPETTSVSVQKNWVCEGNEAKMPESVTVYLLASIGGGKAAAATDNNGEPIEPLTLNAANYWKGTFENLPKYKEGGKLVTYSIEEVKVENFDEGVITVATTELKDSEGEPAFAFKVTNTLTQEYVKLKGEKTWEHNGFDKAYAVPTIEIQLFRDNETTPIATEELSSDPLQNADQKIAYAFENLPKYAVGTIDGYMGEYDGHTFVYTVKEVMDSKFVKVFDSIGPVAVESAVENELIYNFTNTLKVKDISGTKTWAYPGGETFVEYPAIEIQLKVGEDVWYTKNLPNMEADDPMAYTFENLPVYDSNGDEIQYTVVEVLPADIASGFAVTPKDGHAVAATEADTTGVVFRNEMVTTELTGTKSWNDYGNEVTHPTITINLLRDGTEIAEIQLPHGTTEYAFTELPMYAVAKFDGYIGEDGIEYDGYTGNIDGHLFVYTVTEDVVFGYATESDDTEFTNILEVVEVEGEKTWVDMGNEHQRPETITINLLRNGVKYKKQVVSINQEDGTYSYSFTDLPKYALAGLADIEGMEVEINSEFIYTVTEDAVTDYDAAYDGVNVQNTISQKFIDISGQKAWIDGNDEPGERPESITIRLWRDGTEIASETVTAATNWAWSFDNLAVYAVDVEEEEMGAYPYGEESLYDGHTFIYTVTEDEVPEYTTFDTVTEEEIYQNILPTDVSFTNTIAQKYTDVVGAKTWVDGNDEDDKRPAKIIINLLRDGVEIDEKVVTAADGWKWAFKDLPMYAVEPIDGKPVVYPYDARDGHIFKYTVTEDAVAEYTTEIEGFDVTNTLEQEYVRVSGTKTWVDPEGTWHNPITINLLRDGVKIAKIVLENGEETYAFRNLPKYAVPCAELKDYKGELDGHTFRYSVTEDLVPGYTSVQNGTNFTNTIEQEWIPVNVTKIWADKGATGVEHPAITVRLHRDGVEIDSVVLENGDTYHSFTNLPRYDLVTGQRYVYTVTEDPVEGYTTRINGYTIINTTEGPEMVTISGTKTWDDDGREHDNATEVKIQLTCSIEGGAAEVVTDAEIVWNGNVYAFYNLLKADENGNEYTYSIEEQPVDGYDAFYEGYNIINRLRYDVIEVGVSGTKYWNDGNDANKIRPEEITVMLLRDGKVIETATVDAQNGWNYSFDKLPDNDGYGHYYTYTVTEQLVPGYWLMVDGNDLYNTPQEVERFRFRKFREEELEELLEIFDYGVPLWGGLLGTGDEVPAYPFVFGGAGLIALVAYLMVNRKRKKA